jgi:hypothetical protein
MFAIRGIISVPFFSTKIITRSVRGIPRGLPQHDSTFRLPEPEQVSPKQSTKVETKVHKEKKQRTFRQHVKSLKHQNSQ